MGGSSALNLAAVVKYSR